MALLTTSRRALLGDQGNSNGDLGCTYVVGEEEDLAQDGNEFMHIFG